MNAITITLTVEQVLRLIELLQDKPAAEAPVVAEKVVQLKVAKRAKTAKSEEAPWGYKKDGTPRARPGRKVA